VSGRKHNKIKIDSFESILLFFLSADAAFRQARIGKLSASLCGTYPKERKAKYLSKFIQFVKTVCFRPDTNYWFHESKTLIELNHLT
jgi:hypothetical protein